MKFNQSISHCIFVGTLPGSSMGGISTAMQNGINILETRGITCTAIPTHDPNNTKLKNLGLATTSLCKIIKAPSKNCVYYLHAGPRTSLIRKILIASVLRILGRKIVTHYHSPIYADYLRTKSPHLVLLYTLAKLSNKNIALSKYWQRVLKHATGKPFVITPNPISNWVETRSRHLSPHIKLVTVARLIEEKNVQECIHYLRINTTAHLRIIGDGPFRTNLEEIASSIPNPNRVHFTGWLSSDQVKQELLAADLFILPSKYDSFGMVYVEALSLGLPVIAPTLPAVKSALFGLAGVGHADKHTEFDVLVQKLINCDSNHVATTCREKYSEDVYFENIIEVLTT